MTVAGKKDIFEREPSKKRTMITCGRQASKNQNERRQFSVDRIFVTK